MHLSLKSIVALSALGLAAALPSARAQLALSGNAYGTFVDPGLAFTSVSNGPVVSLFASGVPYRPQGPYFDTKTSITFTGTNFSLVGDGGQMDLGTIKIKNGITKLGTTAHWAAMDLFLDLPSQGITSLKLTTLLFTIDSTSNNGLLNVPDLFLVGHTAVSSLMLGGRTATFDLQLTKPNFAAGSGASISENSADTFGLFADLHFSPVPEASTYALWAGVLLVGLVGLRRVRAGHSTA
jgi:hypothetical protein